ncbi:NeuD/PglB/VioB family sugar acetyltransferase [Planococcus maritimus]|uniref:NeuD/PglB/VioB family sugar acetyltransferase n=1 Tax=Planococcus maritimus TaxID=192421 RepID=UPI0007938D57|nr:NeuD/PglB/VioB family sugar acetyltransferase [Planococcus maritimus]KYG59433.1 hypothetical protein AY633_04100 [Planococcus maritimus]
MLSNDIFIIGAGTYGEAMCELAEHAGYTIAGFFDEDESKIGQTVMESLVIGKFSTLPAKYIKGRKFIVAIGNNEIRCNLMEFINKHNGETPTLIHSSAVISPTAKIGQGVYIQANATVWTKVEIKDYCILSPGVVIAHHTMVERGCLVSTLTSVGASIKIKEKVFIGMGCTIVTGLNQIGESTIIGAGTVLLQDAESHSVYVGTPGRKIKSLVGII